MRGVVYLPLVIHCSCLMTGNFKDFCVRRIEQASYGRREIEIAEQVSTQFYFAYPFSGKKTLSQWLPKLRGNNLQSAKIELGSFSGISKVYFLSTVKLVGRI